MIKDGEKGGGGGVSLLDLTLGRFKTKNEPISQGNPAIEIAYFERMDLTGLFLNLLTG